MNCQNLGRWPVVSQDLSLEQLKLKSALKVELGMQPNPKFTKRIACQV
jgi:hypothetical protein